MENKLGKQTEISLCSAEFPENWANYFSFDSFSLASWAKIKITAHARPRLQNENKYSGDGSTTREKKKTSGEIMKRLKIVLCLSNSQSNCL